jgi:hypothetical protein
MTSRRGANSGRGAPGEGDSSPGDIGITSPYAAVPAFFVALYRSFLLIFLVFLMFPDEVTSTRGTNVNLPLFHGKRAE